MEEDRREHIDIVTALRGVAALCVVLFHVRIFLWVGWNEINQNRGYYSSCDVFLSWFSVPTAIMGEFVLLFFIVSGFCIHYPNVGRCKEFRLKPYLLRRFVRIYPPYAIALIISMLVLFIAVRSEYTKSIMPSLLLIQNYYPLVNSQIKSNYSLWSIPTEIELYVLYAVFVSVYKFLGKGLLVLVVFVTLSLSIVFLFNHFLLFLRGGLVHI
jgi:peptidoglycan/LPS O-acetylase OafA/YrhL